MVEGSTPAEHISRAASCLHCVHMNLTNRRKSSGVPSEKSQMLPIIRATYPSRTRRRRRSVVTSRDCRQFSSRIYTRRAFYYRHKCPLIDVLRRFCATRFGPQNADSITRQRDCRTWNRSKKRKNNLFPRFFNNFQFLRNFLDLAWLSKEEWKRDSFKIILMCQK